MSGIFLADTNAVSDALKDNASILHIMTEADVIYIPSIVLGELYFMAENSAKQLANYAQINQFIGKHLIVPCDEYTSLEYAKLRFQLQKKGRPIPENDLWIASLARQYQVPLLTRDQHFQYIDGLTIVNWS